MCLQASFVPANDFVLSKNLVDVVDSVDVQPQDVVRRQIESEAGARSGSARKKRLGGNVRKENQFELKSTDQRSVIPN